MTPLRLPYLDRFIEELRRRGVSVSETVDGGLRVFPPSKVSEAELELLAGQKPHILALLRGDEVPLAQDGEHIEADEPALPEPEPPAPEPAEPEQEEPPPVEAAPVASPRDGALWTGGSVRPALRPRDGEPTRQDFMLGLAISQRQADGHYRLVWADPHASREMSLMLKRLYGG